MPQIDLGGLVDGMFGVGTSTAFSDVVNPVQSMLDFTNDYTSRLAKANETRLSVKAKRAASRCDCAVTMLTEHRVSLGLYAGTGRMVTPSLFKNLEASLQTSLRSSQCSQKG